MNKLTTALALTTLLFLSAKTSATTLSVFDDESAVDTWDREGPRAKVRTNPDKSKGIFKYNANQLGFDSFTWRFTHVAEVSENITFDWKWTGNHSWFLSSGSLTFISGDETTLLGESDGSGFFKVTGSHTAAITAGKTFGFEVTGQHLDFAQKLYGRIQMYNVVGDYSEPAHSVPVSGTPAFILALLGLGVSRIRKAAKTN